MIGIILLFILAIWFFIVKKLSGYCVLKMQPGSKKTIMHIAIFILFFISPVADEIVGGFQFRSLCNKGTKLIYDAEKVRGKKLLWSGTLRKQINNTIIPIEEASIALIDLGTDEPLIKYKEYYATGGWLSRFIAFNSVTRPYTFTGVCGAKKATVELRNELNIETTFKR